MNCNIFNYYNEQKLPVYSRESNTSDNLEDEAVELEESLETDLCLLWDMTADKDVALWLFQHDILDIMKCVVEESIAPRLTVTFSLFQL